MFSGSAGRAGLRRLVWVSGSGAAFFVTVMLALFALFGPFAVLAIVLVLPASVAGLGTRLLCGGRLSGAAVTLIAVLPCAVLAVAVPRGHGFTAAVFDLGGVLVALCCALLGLTAEQLIARPAGRGGVTVTFLACVSVAGTVTFLLAVILGEDLARGWMAPSAAACAGLFALAAAVACGYLGRRRAGAAFLALALVHPVIWFGVSTAAHTVRRVPAVQTVREVPAVSPTPAPRTPAPARTRSHCACHSGNPCPCPGG